MKNNARKYLKAIERVEREINIASESEEYAQIVRRLADTLTGIEWVIQEEGNSARSDKIIEELKVAQARVMTVKTVIQAERVRLLGVLPHVSVLADSKMWS